jgi:hypothetical protein
LDVVSGVFLKHLVDVAERRLAGREEAWLAEAVGRWRFHVVCGDCGLFLDEGWSAEQVEVVRELAVRACEVLSGRGAISAEEMMSWALFEGQGVFPRGYGEVTGEAGARLWRAIVGR